MSKRNQFSGTCRSSPRTGRNYEPVDVKTEKIQMFFNTLTKGVADYITVEDLAKRLIKSDMLLPKHVFHIIERNMQASIYLNHLQISKKGHFMNWVLLIKRGFRQFLKLTSK